MEKKYSEKEKAKYVAGVEKGALTVRKYVEKCCF